MVVDVVEEVETNPANGLLFHHRLVENPAQDVGYDGRRVLNSLSKSKGSHKVYIIKVAQKQTIRSEKFQGLFKLSNVYT